MKILAIALALLTPLSLAVACEEEAALVTLECTDATATSLTAQGQVNRLEAGSLVRRGFVFMEGTIGTPSFNTTPLVNPSFEEGDPPDGWTVSRGVFGRSGDEKKAGQYSGALTMSQGESNAVAMQDVPGYSDFVGKAVVLGAWVYATEPEQARLYVADGVAGQWSSYHSGASGWEFLTTAPLLMNSAATRLRLHFYTYSEAVAYIDGAVLAVGASVFDDGIFGTGAYSLEITQLKPDTSYRVRAFVADLQGVRYGNTVTCTTLP